MSRHPSEADLTRFLRAEDDPKRDRWVTDHLEEGCVHCLLARQKLMAEAHREGARDLDASGAPGDADEQGRLFRKVTRRLARIAWMEQAEESVGPELLRELARWPRDERLRTVRLAPRYRFLGFARYLTTRCREEAFGDVSRSLDLGELAVAVAGSLSRRTYLPWAVTQAEALAEGALGNAHRVAGDLPAAERWLRLARGHRGAPRGDAVVQAELLSLVGSLRIDQARFQEAEAVLEEGLRHARILGGAALQAKMLLKLSHAVGEIGRPADAVERLEAALPLVDANLTKRLQLVARKNLAWWLAAAGRVAEARSLAESLQAEWREELEGIVARMDIEWLEAHLAIADGRPQSGERILREICQGFREEGAWYDYALASLTLAALLLESGRTAEVRRLAEEMLPAFTSRELHRHALAALALFQRAAAAEQATAAWVRELGRYLRHARSDASLRFEGAPVPTPSAGSS